MPLPPATDLHRELARAIVEHLRASAAEPGQPLSESSLAQAVGTSRLPVPGPLLEDARSRLSVLVPPLPVEDLNINSAEFGHPYRAA
jgi:Bacterial regulatory proteins, gntR family